MKYLVFYCSFVILAFYVLSVLSIKCYVCKEPDRKCRDPFHNDTIFLKDCSQIGMGNATMCRKYMWEIGDGVRYYMRGCAVRGRVSRKQGRDCIERVGTWKTKMWYCQCDNKDGCNGSTNKQISAMTIVLFISLIYWHWMFIIT
ncbi:unnamed protein product [Rotaria sp. Silwood2]|nr:unnamed protein product [Rotaria sp. Silwood2]CAF4507134.1 unnamed protein product [Rotaria sp. Silwood2]